jgi:uncharacterized membrane protein
MLAATRKETAMRKKLLAPATSQQRPAYRAGIVAALLGLPVCLAGVFTASGSLRVMYAVGLALVPVQLAMSTICLRRGRRHDQQAGETKR